MYGTYRYALRAQEKPGGGPSVVHHLFSKSNNVYVDM